MLFSRTASLLDSPCGNALAKLPMVDDAVVANRDVRWLIVCTIVPIAVSVALAAHTSTYSPHVFDFVVGLLFAQGGARGHSRRAALPALPTLPALPRRRAARDLS